MSQPITLHPPLEKGEKFLGNTSSKVIRKELSHIQGIRLATPAYDLYGKKIPDTFAMIATESAANEYSKIMDAELSLIKRGLKKN